MQASISGNTIDEIKRFSYGDDAVLQAVQIAFGRSVHAGAEDVLLVVELTVTLAERDDLQHLDGWRVEKVPTWRFITPGRFLVIGIT